LPATGHAGLDLAIEAGPRVITPDTPEDILKELGKYNCFSPLREALKRMALEERADILVEIQRTCRENRILEELYHGTTAMLPHARIPKALIDKLEAENKEAWNPAMREDTLKCYPGLRLNVKRGRDGIHYVNGDGR
jgi:coenzyme F420-reducing hydrogenase beta subunit